MKRSIPLFAAVLAFAALASATPSFARARVVPDGEPIGTVNPKPRNACFIVRESPCSDCPGKISFYCEPLQNGAYTSCQTLAPSLDCANGYCAEADPGPTGGHCS